MIDLKLKSKYFAIVVDRTGSMSPIIDDVRVNLKELATNMFQDISDLQMAIIAHGDYCDGDDCISILDFTNDLDKIMSFITNVRISSGGDAPECIEYALNVAQSLQWNNGGSLLLVGDSEPHPVSDNPNKLDWHIELNNLLDKKIKVFGLQCMKSDYNQDVNRFWDSVAEIADTPLLQLERSNEMAVSLGAVAYAGLTGSEGLETYYRRTKDEIYSTSYNVNLSSLTSYCAKE